MSQAFTAEELAKRNVKQFYQRLLVILAHQRQVAMLQSEIVLPRRSSPAPRLKSKL